ncbi:hypothetical protein RHMOL_Rhmol05G0167200 [Rhododendron molle]|uniref:Uncharacterized protein n=1 Tax=Rhododendron molle TaxID=49168 RepID=A0ACC0NS80_RHOML|nr:hypothetical protein RHMOL_Rhmol05G0167200 [Rhododendron molle]
MAGVLMGNFPDLLESNPSRVSSQGYSIDLLDKAAAPTLDGPPSRQIQDLKAELLKVKGLLEEKDELLQQAVVSPIGGQNPIQNGALVQVISAPSRAVVEAVLEPIDSVISQEYQVLASDQRVEGLGIRLDEVHEPGSAQMVFYGGSTSNPNKFAVLTPFR